MLGIWNIHMGILGAGHTNVLYMDHAEVEHEALACFGSGLPIGYIISRCIRNKMETNMMSKNLGQSQHPWPMAICVHPLLFHACQMRPFSDESSYHEISWQGYSSPQIESAIEGIMCPTESYTQDPKDSDSPSTLRDHQDSQAI